MAFVWEMLPVAQKEFWDAIIWYNGQQEGLGGRFVNAVENRLDLIIGNPLYYVEKKNGYREVIVDPLFPYVIIYRIKNRDALVVVTSIFHTKRNPKNKYRR